MTILKTTTAMALLAGVGLGLGALPAVAQVQGVFNSALCDTDNNGYISAGEARECADREYTTLLGDEESLTPEWLTQEEPVEGLPPPTVIEIWFVEIDADEDGQISREEWTGWREQGYAELSGGIEQGVVNEEYERWHLGESESEGNAPGSGTGGGAAGGSGG